VAKEEDDLSPDTPENISLDDLKKTWIAKSNGACVFISATKLENIQEIRDLLYEKVKEIHEKRYPYDDFLY
jgi:GTP-binding protein HflX